MIETKYFELDIASRINTTSTKWRDPSKILCDHWMPPRLKSHIYKTTVTFSMLYGAEWWTIKKCEEAKFMWLRCACLWRCEQLLEMIESETSTLEGVNE